MDMKTYVLLDDDGILIERICTDCLTLKDRTNFYTNQNTSSGYNAICKSCSGIRSSKSNRERRQRERISRKSKQKQKFTLQDHNQKKLSPGHFTLVDVRFQRLAPRVELIQDAHGWTMILDDRRDIILVGTQMESDAILDRLLHDGYKIGEARSTSESLRYKITLVENRRRLPFRVDTLISYTSLTQYYIWMNSPRTLTLDEISALTDTKKSALEFILRQEKQVPPAGEGTQEVSVQRTDFIEDSN